ncbi:MAG: hypothetical protein ABS87_09795 [Sphingomonas sp. SCN 67-18]|uniref:hypothetical protein n=1 Tax=uncultured Sphingomonas sp. TaxID=158754 RepID=UPI00086B1823|nr:hypothetical protein [Sphingomonas sp. SCN 67-18]ODU20626.1 MAG: hypothetical protein ABS87_09795 [Sphingomonas sp. SCN 67-18]
MTAQDENEDDAMRTLLRSDLFRNFMGGFIIGAVAILALQPGARTDVLVTKIQAAYATLI